MTQDRVGGTDLKLSQRFLAMSLGVRRPTVTVVAKTYQTDGLIRYSYGRVTILDRKALEAASCECYAVVRRKWDALLPPRTP